MNVKEIENIAILARKDFEDNKIDYNLLQNLYQKYNKLDNPNKFIEQSKSLFPSLNCGLTTLYLKDKLKQGQVVKGQYKNNNHTFLLIDKIVVDITSDQYDGPKVYVGPLKEPWKIENNNP